MTLNVEVQLHLTLYDHIIFNNIHVYGIKNPHMMYLLILNKMTAQIPPSYSCDTNFVRDDHEPISHAAPVQQPMLGEFQPTVYYVQAVCQIQ